MKLGIFKNNELIHTVMGDLSSLEIKHENNTIEVLQDGESVVTVNPEPVEFKSGLVANILPEVYFAMV